MTFGSDRDDAHQPGYPGSQDPLHPGSQCLLTHGTVGARARQPHPNLSALDGDKLDVPMQVRPDLRQGLFDSGRIENCNIGHSAYGTALARYS